MPSILPPKAVSHPGDFVAEYLDVNGWSQRDLARRTGLTPKTISEICNGKAPISPTTALALEKVLGRPAHFWLNLQRLFEEAQARVQELERSSDWTAWTRKFPLKEMKRFKYVQPATEDSDVHVLLSYLGVSSPESWDSVWQNTQVAYRQTKKFTTSVEAISVWVRETELLATEVRTAPFDEERLRASIDALRRQTRQPVPEAIDEVQKLCADAGVSVVWVPELSNTGISGCARWLTATKALIGLTLRYKTDDQMWFTFFHELGHILMHRKIRSFVLDNAADHLADGVVDSPMQELEEEANRFAADTLIPPQALADFVSKGDFDNDAIHQFAEAVGIGPGLVVGRLQFLGHLQRHQGNALKQKVQWDVPNERH